MDQTERTAPGTASRSGSQISGDQASDLALTVAPLADIPPHPTRRPCVCGIQLCDRPDPSACAVHGELHRMVCLGGGR